jgi:trk system potassium uptake protein TrkA
MRVVFVGGGALSERTARILVQRGHEVVVIEREQERIEALADSLDCGFLHGDGTRPAVLRDADPDHTAVLLCLTGNDQTNIIASLVGRSLGFGRVLTRIDSEEFEHICLELGLRDTVIPARTIGRYLADTVEGHDILELSSAIKGDARLFAFVATGDDDVRVRDLELPADCRVSHLYRDGETVFADADTHLRKGDEVILLTHRRNLGALAERWSRGA